MIGAIVIRSAGNTSALRTSILSARLTPTFRRSSPSIRMMPLPSSSCMTRKSFAAVDFFPMIWMISPTSTPSATRVFVSTRARPKPTSDWGASATLRTIRSGTSLELCRLISRFRGDNRNANRVFSRSGPSLAHFARFVYDEFARLDSSDLAVRTDVHRLPLHEVRRRRLEFDVLPFDALGGQFPADPEKSAGRLHPDRFPFDRRNLRRAAEIDLDFLRREALVDTDRTARSEFLRLHAPLDLKRTAQRDLLGFDRPLDLEASARLDGFRVQVPRDADGTRRPELLDLHVTFETTSACDARHFCDEGSLNPDRKSVV